MKIESIQFTKKTSSINTSNKNDSGEDFSKIFAQISNTKNQGKTQPKNIRPKEEGKVKKEDDKDTKNDINKDINEDINPLGLYLNMTFIENQEDLNTIDPSVLESLGEEIDIESNDLQIPINEDMVVFDENIKDPEEQVSQVIGNSMEEDGFKEIHEKALTENKTIDIEDMNKDISKDERILFSKEVDGINSPKDTSKEIKDDFGKLQDKNFKQKEIPREESIAITKKPIEDENLKVKNMPKIEKIFNHDINIIGKDSIQNSSWLDLSMRRFETMIFNPETNLQYTELGMENIENINDSIIRLMETTNTENSSTMKVQLYPKELGYVNITLKLEEGKMIAKILVDNNHVKQLFANSMNELNSSLIKQNIHVEEVHIDLNPNANGNTNPDGNQNHNSNQAGEFNHNRGRNSTREEMVNHVERTIESSVIEETGLSTKEISILA